MGSYKRVGNIRGVHDRHDIVLGPIGRTQSVAFLPQGHFGLPNMVNIIVPL
jgi:hypothetical protein